MIRRTFAVFVLWLAGCAPRPQTAPRPVAFQHGIIPLPGSIQLDPAQSFVVDTLAVVYIDEAADASVAEVAGYLKTMLSPMVRSDVGRLVAGGAPAPKALRLTIDPANAFVGDEGYDLTVTPALVTIAALFE